MPRDANGRFVRDDGESYGTHIDEKGYPRISAGPLRGVRVHTLVSVPNERLAAQRRVVVESK